MKTFVKGMGLLFMSLLFASGASATTYYVSELFGNNSNNGTSEAAPFATIQKAVDVMVAGDIVVVDFGTYNESVVIAKSGTSAKPIVVKAKEKGQAEVNAGAVKALPTFKLHKDNIYVMEGVFRSLDKFSEGGKSLTKKDKLDSLVAGTVFQDRANGKLYVWSTGGVNPATLADTLYFQVWSFEILDGGYLTIDGFTVKKGINAAMKDDLVSAPGLTIQNNVFQGDNDPLTSDKALVIDGGAVNYANTYEGFKVSANTFNGYYQAIHIKTAGRKSVVINNSFINIGVPAANAEAIRVEGHADYKTSAQCQGLLFDSNIFSTYGRCFDFRTGKLDSVKIQNCIANKPGSLFMINANATNVHVINNTIYGCGAEYALRFNLDAKYGRIYNNILAYNRTRSLFFDNTGDKENTGDFDYNYWVFDPIMGSTGDQRLARARIPTVNNGPGGPHCLYGHPMVAGNDTLVSVKTGEKLYWTSVPDMKQPPLPLFQNAAIKADTFWLTRSTFKAEDYKPAKSFLGIDAGLASVAPKLDFFGNTRDSKPDIGAIEYGAGTAVTVQNPFPEEFSLSQNYPNPFNPVTTFEYRLAKSGFLRVRVYNIAGQLVATVFEGFREAGVYPVTWNGMNDQGKTLPSGLYFCRLEMDQIHKVTKMMLVK